jgi:hypothetical protein
MAKTLNLDEVKTPVLEVQYKESVFQIDPFEVLRKADPFLQQLGKMKDGDFSGGGIAATYTGMKEALGMPDLSDFHMIKVYEAVNEFVEEQIKAKK